MLKKPALAEVADLQESGYAEIENPLNGDMSLGLAMLDKADACSECIGRMARHPVIRRLRRRLANETLPTLPPRVRQDVDHPPVVETKLYNKVKVQVPRARQRCKRQRAVA